jgi:hypothetical protein
MTKIKKKTGVQFPNILILDDNEITSDKALQEADFVFKRAGDGTIFIIKYSNNIYCGGKRLL